MTYIASILISLAILFGGFYGIANYATLGDISALSTNKEVGVSLTTISSATKISDLATILPANFNALNSGKIEVSTTTLPLLTTTLALSSVGTITTGTWSATAIAVNKGGSGTTAPTLYMVVLGNGTAGFTYASSTGTSGQFLTSNGAGAFPSWQTSAVDTGINYTWTGRHYFNAGLIASSSPYNLIASTTIYTLNVGTIYASSSINVTPTEGVRVARTTAQNYTGGTFLLLPLDTETYDLANEFNTSTYTFTATSSGYYVINAFGSVTGAAGQASIYIYKNSAQYSTSTAATVVTYYGGVSITDVLSLAQGDTIKIYALHTASVNWCDISPCFLNIYKR